MIKVEDSCVSNMSDAVRVRSPSKVYMEIGANMAEDTLREIEVLSTDEMITEEATDD